MDGEADPVGATDAVLTQKLAEAEPAVVSGWALLAARLELIGRRREMVGCIKISEAALLLSALLLFFRHSITDATTDPLRSPQAAFPIEAPAGGELAVAAATWEKTPAPVAARSVHDTKPVPRVAPLATLPPRPLKREVALPRVRNGALAPIAREDQRAYFHTSTANPLLRLPELPVAVPIRYYLNLFVSPLDVNQVVTLANPNLGISDRSSLSTGFSLGALIDIEQGRHALQTGLLYGYRSYTPGEILRLENSSQNSDQQDVRYGRLKYHTASVPLNYWRTLHTTNKWRISAGMGLTVNLILSAEFQLGENVTRKDLIRELDAFRRLASEEGSPKAFTSVGATNRFVNPSPGILDGGGTLENSSLYVGGSLRVERLLSERWSVYLSPTVTRLFTVRDDDGGKGPLTDRIHNTMLRAGARMRLTDK
jgi:hypothetical protein